MWKEHIEEGQIFYVHEQLGNIQKITGGQFVSMVPKIVRLGPFDTLEEAKQAVEDKEGLNRAIDNYNLHLTNLIKQLKEK